jgi:hypothetical protein
MMSPRDDYIFVTGYIDLHALEARPGTKNDANYMEFGSPLLNCGQALCCFTQSANRAKIESLVDKANTSVRLVDFEVDQLRYNSPKHFQASLPACRNVQKDTHWYLALNHQKVFWLKQAAELYPDHDRFCWIDFGINHVVGLARMEFASALRRFGPCNPTSLTVRRLKKKQSHLSMHDEINDFGSAYLVGGILAGTRKQIDWIAEQQDLMIQEILDQYDAITWEANVWSLIANRHPEKFRTYKAGWDATILTNFPGKTLFARMTG